jgi:hypothetical protein
MPGQQGGRGDRDDLAPRGPRDQGGQGGEPGPVTALLTALGGYEGRIAQAFYIDQNTKTQTVCEA